MRPTPAQLGILKAVHAQTLLAVPGEGDKRRKTWRSMEGRWVTAEGERPVLTLEGLRLVERIRDAEAARLSSLDSASADPKAPAGLHRWCTGQLLHSLDHPRGGPLLGGIRTMRDFFRNKMAALLARLDQALLQQERVEVAELAAEHWRKAAKAAEEGRVQACKERDQLLRLRDHLEAQVDCGKKDRNACGNCALCLAEELKQIRAKCALLHLRNGTLQGLLDRASGIMATGERLVTGLEAERDAARARVDELQRQVDCGKKDGEACGDCAVCWELRAVRTEEELSGARAAKRRWKALAKKMRQARGAQLVKDPPALPSWDVWLRASIDPDEIPPGMSAGDPSSAQTVAGQDAETAAESWVGEFFGAADALAWNEAVVPVCVRAADGTVTRFDVHACLVPALDAREPYDDEDEEDEGDDDGE